MRLARRLGRIVFSLFGATVGALVVAAAEARTALAAASSRGTSYPRMISAELGAIVPVSLAVGAVVATASIFLEPAGPLAPADYVSALRAEPVLARSRTAALAPLAIAVSSVWLVVVAQAGRALLAEGAGPAAGFALAVVAVAWLLVLAALALTIMPAVRRALASFASRNSAALDPVTTSAFALALVVLVVGLGAVLGDTGGEGPTLLAIFGVIKRQELDLRPVVDLATIGACAWTAPLVFVTLARRGTPARALVPAAAAVFGAIGLTVHEAVALEREPGIAQVIESYAPLGRMALALDRRATDRDHDGASPFFGGGDCNDADPGISPFAIDVPGNGIDEDCSGADAPAPVVATHAGARAARRPGAGFARDLNLVLITVDTLRASETGFLGYDKPTTPNLDALAARSVVFERAYAMASYTGKALAPMLIGKYPSETLRDGGHFNKYAAGNTFLAERLHDAGFSTFGAASHWYFRSVWGLTQGFDAFDLSAVPKLGQTDTDTTITGPALTDAAIRMLLAHAVSGRFFLWVHYFDPHAQYVAHEGAPDFADPARPPGWRMRALYDGEVWFTDRAVGRLLDYVRAQPWSDRTVIVVTSDHGESMGEHGIAFQHGFEVWESLMRVPLIVYWPRIRPHRVPVKRSVIDLVPTLLDVLAVPPPGAGELSGQSAAADLLAFAGDPYEERDVYIDMPDGPFTHMRHALIRGATPGMKLIHFGGRQYQLYDLARDPGEGDDLSGDPARLEPMIQALQAKRSTLREVAVKPDGPALP